MGSNPEPSHWATSPVLLHFFFTLKQGISHSVTQLTKLSSNLRSSCIPPPPRELDDGRAITSHSLWWVCKSVCVLPSWHCILTPLREEPNLPCLLKRAPDTYYQWKCAVWMGGIQILQSIAFQTSPSIWITSTCLDAGCYAFPSPFPKLLLSKPEIKLTVCTFNRLSDNTDAASTANTPAWPRMGLHLIQSRCSHGSKHLHQWALTFIFKVCKETWLPSSVTETTLNIFHGSSVSAFCGVSFWRGVSRFFLC